MTDAPLVRIPAALALLLGALGPSGAAGQALATPEAGPVIHGYGAVYPVPDPTFATPAPESLRVVFEVAQGAEDPGEVNVRINTVARFLNMHAQAGVSADELGVALVLHGTAGKDALGNAGYRERFGVDNPNLDLLEQLMHAGVEVVLCGQTAMHRGLPADELAPSVKMALSAMTAMASFQSRGYALIAF